MQNRRIFLYDNKTLTALREYLKLPDSTIRHALYGRNTSEQAKRIREVAISEFGGFYAPKKSEQIAEQIRYDR